MSGYGQISCNSNLSKSIETWGREMGIGLKIPSKRCARYSKTETELWNHIMRCMRPEKEVSVIRKNILIRDLERLKKTEQGRTVVVDGVKNTKDLEQVVKYNELNEELHKKNTNIHNLQKSLKVRAKKIVVLEKEQESIEENIKEIKRKNFLMKMNLQRIDRFLKKTNESLNLAKICENVIADWLNSKQNQNSDKDEIDSILGVIEAVYHSCDLSDKKVNLSLENNSLWDKVYDCVFVSPHVLNNNIIENLQKNNSEMEQFLKTSMKICPESNNVMDEIHHTHIKLFFQIHKLKNDIQELSGSIIYTKQDILSKFSEYLNCTMNTSNNRNPNENEEYNLAMSYLNKVCDEMIKRKKNECLKLKIEELRAETDHLDFDQSLLQKQTDKLNNLNEKIEEKAKIVSKYNSVILNDRYGMIDHQTKKCISEAVKNFHKLNSIINKRRDGSSDSNNEDDNIFTNMKGLFRKELELIVDMPKEVLNQFQTTANGVVKLNPIPTDCSSFYFPYNVLLNKTWINVLNKLESDVNETPTLISPYDTVDMKAITTLKEELNCDFSSKKEKIDFMLNSAKQSVEIARADYSLLLDEKSSVMINKILSTEKTVVDKSFEDFILNFKRENGLNYLEKKN